MPTDLFKAFPRTLIRASRDFGEKQADFAVSAGMAALHWMARGYGYQMNSNDVLEAYSSILNAASVKGASEAEIKAQIREVISRDNSGTNMVLATLRDKLIV